MDYLVIALRLIHVVGGIVWVGSAVMLYKFVAPTVNATQDAGQQFMRHLMSRTRFTAVMTSAAILTIVAGLILMGRDASAGPTWIKSGPGIGYSIGGAFALVGFVCGMLVGMTTAALSRLGSEIQDRPTTEQSAKLERLRKRLNIVNPINFYSLLIAAALMAIARYLVF
jgi:uncharacterized membrane protein